MFSGNQERIIENLLRKKTDEKEMINRRLITGGAFQGYERDIIILSMVIAPNVPIYSTWEKSRFTEVNEATSWARDQMILFILLTRTN